MHEHKSKKSNHWGFFLVFISIKIFISTKIVSECFFLDNWLVFIIIICTLLFIFNDFLFFPWFILNIFGSLLKLIFLLLCWSLFLTFRDFRISFVHYKMLNLHKKVWYLFLMRILCWSWCWKWNRSLRYNIIWIITLFFLIRLFIFLHEFEFINYWCLFLSRCNCIVSFFVLFSHLIRYDEKLKLFVMN